MANGSLYNELLGQLTRATSGLVSSSSLGGSSALGSSSKMPTESLIKPTKDTEAKSSSFGAKTTATSIKFGNPSQSVQSVSGGSTNWTQLASNVASGGLTNLLGGAGSLGLGSIVSGLIGLFSGGSKSLPALPLFTLPQSQDVTVYTGSSGSAVYQGAMDQTVISNSQPAAKSSGTAGSSNSPAANEAIKTTSTNVGKPTAATPATTAAHPPSGASTLPTPASVAPTDVNSQWFMERSGDIAAAVRNAMLNSSSLNDVVAEI